MPISDVQKKWLSHTLIYIFFFASCPFRAAPAAYGGSQARALIRAVAASLCCSHGDTRIQAASATYTAAQGNARSPTHWARPGIEPESSRMLAGLFPLRHNGNSCLKDISKRKHLNCHTTRFKGLNTPKHPDAVGASPSLSPSQHRGWVDNIWNIFLVVLIASNDLYFSWNNWSQCF